MREDVYNFYLEVLPRSSKPPNSAADALLLDVVYSHT